MPPRSKKKARSPVTVRGFRKGIPSPLKGSRFPVEVLSAEEVGRLIKAASGRAPTGVRNRALLATMYRGGLRIAEALALHKKDIDRQAGTVRILHGKNDKARVVGLDAGAMALIERWLDKRRTLGINGKSHVFCTLKGEPLWDTYVRTMIGRLAQRAGIEKRVHPHALRHTHAAELARERFPVNLIQQQLGHANLAVTSRYLDHLAPQERIEALKAREWKP
jgi:site-specific recombinase XerD